MNGRLAGKSAIIFGGSGGIGQSSARRFAEEGARLLVADWAEEAGRAFCEDLARSGLQAEFVQVDIAAPDSVKRALARAVECHGQLDILYNCVGGSSLADGLIEDVDDEEFWRTIKVDLYGSWLACKYSIPLLAASGAGSIILMSSAAAVRGQMGVNAYSAAKGGVSALTRTLALSYAAKAIRVNAIAPGAVGTPRVRAMLQESEAVRANVEGRQLLGVVEPHEVAALALHLASDEARHITGQIFSIDGGLTI